MATNEAITPRHTLDRNGNPCPVAMIRRRMENHDALDNASTLDSYMLASTVARGMNEQIDRAESLGDVLRLVRERLDDDGRDDGELRSMLDMAIEFEVKSANKVFDLSGQVLAVIERGKLYE